VQTESPNIGVVAGRDPLADLTRKLGILTRVEKDQLDAVVRPGLPFQEPPLFRPRVVAAGQRDEQGDLLQMQAAQNEIAGLLPVAERATILLTVVGAIPDKSFLLAEPPAVAGQALEHPVVFRREELIEVRVPGTADFEMTPAALRWIRITPSASRRAMYAVDSSGILGLR